MSSISTNWHVVTGGPSSGKTKTLEYLYVLGNTIVPEMARMLIEDEMMTGKTLQEIRQHEGSFQERVLQMKIETENQLDPQKHTFLDRGIGDSIAYFRLNSMDPQPVFEASKKRIYKTVFLLEQLPFQSDEARTENEDSARQISDLLFEAYSQLKYKVIRVPVMPVHERAVFILAEINIT